MSLLATASVCITIGALQICDGDPVKPKPRPVFEPYVMIETVVDRNPWLEVNTSIIEKHDGRGSCNRAIRGLDHNEWDVWRDFDKNKLEAFKQDGSKFIKRECLKLPKD